MAMVSCFKQTIIFNQDNKSGEMIIEYSLTDDLYQLLDMGIANMPGDNEINLDSTMLLEKELIMEEFAKKKQLVEPVKVNIELNENQYKGFIHFKFNSFDELLKELPLDYMPVNVVRENNKITITQNINTSSMEELEILKEFLAQQKESDIEYFDNIKNNVNFSFLLKTPRDITNSSGGKIEKNKKNINWSFKLVDLLDETAAAKKFEVTF